MAQRRGAVARLRHDGTDLRKEPLMHRKGNAREPAAPLARRPAVGRALDGGVVFAGACKLGLEGIVSKRRDAPYQHGRSRTWLKIKSPESAMLRVWEERR